MTTAWTLTATEVCTDALRHLNVIGEGDAASGDQQIAALRGLDTVLKELPLAGYAWPKLSGEVALTWASVQTMTLPTDYYGYPVAWKTLNGQKCQLTQIPHADWVQKMDRTATGTATSFYISPANVFYIWPVPSSDPVVTLQYQKIVDDAALGTTPDVLQSFKGALGWGVADEIGMMMGAPQTTRVEVAQRWAVKKALFLNNAVPHGPICFGVSE